MKLLFAIPFTCLSLAACSSTGPAPQSSAGNAAPAAAAAAQTRPIMPAETEAQRLSRMQAELIKKSVYFDYDNFMLKPQYQDIVKQNADFMKLLGKDTLEVEGNADDRGSKEYNLALGQKRAESVRKALLSLGVADKRIEAISYGEEKPRASCPEEKCWQENRRVDFVYKSK